MAAKGKRSLRATPGPPRLQGPAGPRGPEPLLRPWAWRLVLTRPETTASAQHCPQGRAARATVLSCAECPWPLRPSALHEGLGRKPHTPALTIPSRSGTPLTWPAAPARGHRDNRSSEESQHKALRGVLRELSAKPGWQVQVSRPQAAALPIRALLPRLRPAAAPCPQDCGMMPSELVQNQSMFSTQPKFFCFILLHFPGCNAIFSP